MRKKMTYSSHVWRKLKKQFGSRKLESSKVDDSLQHHGFNSGPIKYFIPKIDMRNFDGKDIFSTGFVPDGFEEF